MVRMCNENGGQHDDCAKPALENALLGPVAARHPLVRRKSRCIQHRPA